MHAKAILVASIVAVSTVAAGNPACLLAAVNTQTNPANTKDICSNHASDVQNAILKSCPSGDQSAALSAFADTCKSAGVTVATVSPSSSGSSTAKVTGTGSGVIGNSASSTGKPSGSASTSNNIGGFPGITGILGVVVAAVIGGAALVL